MDFRYWIETVCAVVSIGAFIAAAVFYRAGKIDHAAYWMGFAIFAKLGAEL